MANGEWRDFRPITNSKIFIAGHNGMVGSAILRKLKEEGYSHLITRASDELDLRNQHDVLRFFEKEKPEYVFLAAAKVGGILANNTYRAEFLYDNLMIEANVIDAAYRSGVKKLLFLGSSCIYPKAVPQPIKEEYFMTGPLEPTNEPYAIAKIAGIKLCDAYRAQYGCNFISAMPTNLYGPNDNYDLQHSHVLPALLRKFIEATREEAQYVTIWGTGTPRREFLHVDDFADASYFLMQNYDEPGFINVGTGSDISISELAEKLKMITGFRGEIRYDTGKPDGMARKLLDVSRINAMGWEAKITLEEGLRKTYHEVKETLWRE
jgi:GDP-L-fucose synthase